MASTYSPSLRIELIGTGDQSGLWGDTTNNNLGALIEQAITGTQTVLMVDTDYTLTALNGSVDQARNAVLTFTSSGSLTGTRSVFIPDVEKTYVIKNSTTGGQDLLIKTVTGSGVTVPSGQTVSLYCDGTDCYPDMTYAQSLTVTNLNATNLTLGAGTTGTGLYVRQTSPTIISPTISGATCTVSAVPTFTGGVSGLQGSQIAFTKPDTTNFQSNITNDVYSNSVRWFATYGGSTKTFSLDFSGTQGTILTTGNYNSYAPTLTGTGASGTWGISVSGTAGALNSGTAYSVARILGGNGSAASPTYSFSSDGSQDTGFYWVGDGMIGISSNGIYRGHIDSGGNLTMTGNITAYSDERLKSDVKTITHALDIVDELRGVSFVKDGQAGIGVIAQEVQKVLPQVVLEGEEYLSVAYGNIVGVLIEAIKELRAEVKALKGE